MINVDYLKSKSPVFPFIHFETFRNEITGSTIVPFYRYDKVYLRHVIITNHYDGIDGNVPGKMYDNIRFKLTFEANNTKKYGSPVAFYDDEIIDESITEIEYQKPRNRFRSNMQTGRVRPLKRK